MLSRIWLIFCAAVWIILIVMILLFWGAVFCWGQEPAWTNVPVMRQVNAVQLGPVLADIDSRLPATGFVSSQTYQMADTGTWAHEATHGLNSLIRTRGRGTGVDNALYSLRGRAAVIQEPRPVTISEVARFVPLKLRGKIYQLYMIDQARQWNTEPLYVLDEWTSYCNGAAHNLDKLTRGQGIGDGAGDMLFSVETAMYSLALLAAVEQAKLDGRLKHYDDTQLRLYVAWNWDRLMQMLAESAKYKRFIDPLPYYRIFSESGEGKNLRAFSRAYFGRAWASAVMRLAED